MRLEGLLEESRKVLFAMLKDEMGVFLFLIKVIFIVVVIKIILFVCF